MDLETRLRSEHPDELRLWLRLLTCTQLIERQLEQKLRAEFNTSLARFDLLAQLEKAPDGMMMRQLARQLMVTGGNITGLTDQLEKEGLVERLRIDPDKRTTRVALTRQGRSLFSKMARAHEDWVVLALSSLSNDEQRSINRLLGRLKQSNLSKVTT